MENDPGRQNSIIPGESPRTGINSELSFQFPPAVKPIGKRGFPGSVEGCTAASLFRVTVLAGVLQRSTIAPSAVAGWAFLASVC